MARGRAAGYEEQRALILTQAAELFALHGYSATTMNQVAQACALSKPALYHYFRDKHDLLVHIAQAHVGRLQELVDQTRLQPCGATEHLHRLIHSFVQEYAQARYAHRVLIEDVKFMQPEQQQQVLQAQRALVDSFASALQRLWPHLAQQGLAKPATMMLFGVLNWMFTWFKPDGALSYQAMGDLVLQLFMGGVPALGQGQPARAEPR